MFLCLTFDFLFSQDSTRFGYYPAIFFAYFSKIIVHLSKIYALSRLFSLILQCKPRITGSAEEQPANVGASGTAVYLVEGVRYSRPLYSLAEFVISTLHNADSRVNPLVLISNQVHNEEII